MDLDDLEPEDGPVDLGDAPTPTERRKRARDEDEDEDDDGPQQPKLVNGHQKTKTVAPPAADDDVDKFQKRRYKKMKR